LAETILRRLAAVGATVATAESLTGGLLAAALTDVPGASAFYRGGVVSYATDLKASLLGVPVALLEQAGAVDARVAQAMARGASDVCGASYGVSTTGVAGPDPQDGKPVGLVYVAVAHGGADSPAVREHHFTGSRVAIRAQAVQAALTLLHEVLVADPAAR
jgi:nicotinamide-nucleotide amidase